MSTKICIKCGKEQGIEQFVKAHGTGYSNYCESCRKYAREQMRKQPKEVRTAKHRAWREKNRDTHQKYMLDYNLQYWHGITLEQFIALDDEQKGLCAICKQPPIGSRGNDRLHLDHDHETKIVRGLLCTNCNTALGLLKDSVPNLQAAIEYLLKPKGTLVVNPKRTVP